MSDKYDQEAQALLPCPVRCQDFRNIQRIGDLHVPDCPIPYRPTVAARLREDGEIKVKLSESGQWLSLELVEYKGKLIQAQAEIERLKAELTLAQSNADYARS